MFNGATNRLLEKTNEELSILTATLNGKLETINEKIQPPPVVKKPHFSVLSLITALGILALVGIGFAQYTKSREMTGLIDNNNQTIETLRGAVARETRAFEELQRMHVTSATLNAILQEKVDKLQEQNQHLMWMIQKVRTENSAIKKQLLPVHFIPYEKPTH